MILAIGKRIIGLKWEESKEQKKGNLLLMPVKKETQEIFQILSYGHECGEDIDRGNLVVLPIGAAVEVEIQSKRYFSFLESHILAMFRPE